MNLSRNGEKIETAVDLCYFQQILLVVAASGCQLCVKLQLNLLKGAFVRFNDRHTL